MYQCSKKLVKYKEYSCFDQHIQCFYLMHAEVAWVLVSSETQFQPQVILNPDHLLYYLSVSYDYGSFKFYLIMQGIAIKYVINYMLLDTHHSQ